MKVTTAKQARKTPPVKRSPPAKAAPPAALPAAQAPVAGEGALAVLQIGAKLRHARRVRGMRLKELAALVGVSESMLSKVENEQVKPSLKTLHKLAAELHITIGALFGGTNHDNGIVMRRADRPSISTKSVGREGAAGVRLECLLPDPIDKLLYASIHVVEPGGGSEGSIEHQGEEVGYVLTGELELIVEGKTYRLQEGDSFFFRSNLPHGYRNPGRTQTRVMWVNTPSTF